jgi:hypothetical protein
MNELTASCNYFFVMLLVVFFTNLELFDLLVDILVEVAFSERDFVVSLRLDIFRVVGGNSEDNSV